VKFGFLARSGRAPLFCVAALLSCAALPHAFADTSLPVKLAVFDFELDDLSAGAPLADETPADTTLLKQITGDARRLLEQSGRYSLVDTGGADVEAVKGRSLRRCNGCDAGIALKVGAEQSLVGIVTRISRTEYMVRLQISDARTGAVISNSQSGLRMGADYSWSRGVASLIRDRLLDSQP
jgi:uncharacterized protein DUF2380